MFAFLKTRWFAWLVYTILFLLPWQTRYIYDQALISGTAFEYGTMSVYVVELLIAAAFLFGQRLRLRRESERPLKAMGIVLVVSAVSMLFASDRELALAAWSHLVFAAMLFAVLLDVRVDKWSAIKAFVLGLVPPSILGLVQSFIGSSSASKWLGLAAHNATDLGQAVVETGGDRMLRAYGSFTHPNVFGGFLAVGIIALIIFLAHYRKWTPWVLPMPLLIFAFVATFSRSAWLAFVAAVVVGGGLIILKHRSRIRPHMPLVARVVFTFAMAIFVFRTPLFARFDSSQRLEQISTTERLDQYRAYPEIIKNDWLIGSGIGTYTETIATAHPSQPSYAYQPIHNVPLLILAEVGLLGALALLYWASQVDRINYIAIRKGSIGAIGGIMLGTVPLIIIFLDHYFWSNWAGLALLMFLMAMTLRLSED